MIRAFKMLISARGQVFLLKLAVLFLFFPGLASSQGLKLDLESKQSNNSYLKPGGSDVGLSLALTEIPLLKYRVSFNRTIEIDYDNKVVQLKDKLGIYPVTRVFPLSLDSYKSFLLNSQYQESWRGSLNTVLTQTQQGKRRSFFQFDIPVKFPAIVSKFIGEGGPSLKITGNRRISFSGRSSWTDGLVSTATYKPSKFPSLNMEQKYNFTINGNVGSKISVDVSQSSDTKTDLENRLHLRYTGEEDEVLQRIELGNTNLSVGNSLVSYSQGIQGLFGIKAMARIGRLGLTMITSQEKGSTERATFKAGSEMARLYIRDYDYVKNRFYYLGRSPIISPEYMVADFQPGDSLIQFELYISGTNDTTLYHGIACVDPRDPKNDSLQSVYRAFKRVDPKDYFVYKYARLDTVNQTATFPFVDLYSSTDPYAVLAYWAVVWRQERGVWDTIGSLKSGETTINDTTYMLKLIKPDDPRPGQATWEYEWRNVYYLGSKSLDKDGLQIDVYKGVKRDDYNNNTDPNQQNGVRYIRVLGLDQKDQNAQDKPDGIVDLERIDLGQGLLFFPDRHPFNSRWSFTGSEADILNEKVPTIYNTLPGSSDRTDSSKYYIYVESKNRLTQFSLGRFNIMEGSEVVTLNGRPLARGRDYQIDYETGQINFLSQEALDPTAELKIDYEYAPFIQAKKKTLYGLQANYENQSGLKINSVALYKSEATTEQKPRVGEEPLRNFVWGTDVSFSLTPSIMTKLADALPFFGTEEPSKLEVTLRAAQSMPNPNVKNVAYIDDFEGSLEYNDMGIRRGVWTLSSLPQDKQRARMIWYNPYDRVPIREIWPNRQVQVREDLTDVLNLELYPKRPQAPRDTITLDSLHTRSFYPDSSYKSTNGIMRAFAPGSWDQSRARFLEVWLRGDTGLVEIDLGEISEDINGDGIKQTEDKPTNGQNGNGILEPETEDTGLDGIFDADEKLLYPALNTLDDPGGDDWKYDPNNNKNDYSRINGTEDNKDDPDKGRRPDTEDINGNGVLDVIDNYFRFKIELNRNYSLSPYFIPGTVSNGWRLYRIPLSEVSDSSKVGQPDFSRIKFARILLTPSQPADTSKILVRIASIQLVGNRWRSAGVQPMKDSSFTPIDSLSESFEVFVVNTFENTDYNPPPGVEGVLDRNTNVREKEQSLALRFKNLKTGHYGMATRVLYKAENYTNYQGLKMYVNGSQDSIRFFYRMGTDAKNFYEYQTVLHPGWDTRNEVNIDFSQMTALKNYMQINTPKGYTGVRDTVSGNYRIVGDPRLNSILWFAVGTYTDTLRQDSAASSGEFWVDELRVTDVRKVPGWAFSGNIKAKFADLLNLDLTLTRRDSEFRGLTEDRGTGTLSNSLDLSLGTSFEKFLPPSWGLSLPFSFNWNKSLDLPRLKSGSDVVLPNELRSSERTERSRRSFRFQPAYVRDTKNWFLKLTLKRLSINPGITYNREDSRSPVTPISRTEGYGFGLKYDASPRKNLTVSPFKGLKSVFLLKKLSSETISLLPSKLEFSSAVRGVKSYSLSSAGNETSSYIRDFIGNISASMTPLKSVSLNYSFETNRDIRDDKKLKFSFLPKQAQLGIEVRRSQTFGARYSPKWITILDQSFSFNSSYNENADPQLYKGTRVVSNQATKNANFTFHWEKLFGILKPKSKEKKEGKRMDPLGIIRGFVGNLSQNLNSLSINYNITENSNKSGLLDRPSRSYQFGFTRDAGVPFTTDPQTSRSDGSSSRKALDLTSALRLSQDINISTFKFSKQTSVTASSGTPVRTISQTFPDMTLTWSNLEKIKILKRFATSADYSFSYRKKVDTSEDGITLEPTQRNTGKDYTPLSLNLTLKNRVQTRWAWTKQVTESESMSQVYGGNSKTISTSDVYTINASYSFSAPKGLKLPFLRKVKFQSSLSLGLNISIANNKAKSSVSGNNFNVTGETRDFTLVPNASYSFSSQVRGGLSGRWQDTVNKINGEKRHTRELSIWVEFTF